MSKKRVAIYGGGVGGLSAAHELAKLGDRFDVHVYEPSSGVGGKARSQYLPHPGSCQGLPGEHGFRFFPAFYFHLDQTMAEIPLANGGRVIDNLVPSRHFAIARNGRKLALAKRRIGRGTDTVTDAVQLLSTWFSQDALGLSSPDLANMVYAFTKFMMSAETRRAQQFDHMSWYDFTNGDSQLLSDNYRVVANTLPRTMVAMDGRRGSAYTLGKVCLQVLFLDPLRSHSSADRVLNAPTDEAWLLPWYQHLLGKGVQFHFDAALEQLELTVTATGHEIEAGRLSNGSRVHADYHVCAMPADRMVSLVDDGLAQASPSLGRVRTHLSDLNAWMAGAQYFLRKDIQIASGHVIYSDSPWALTSISQAQFWRDGEVSFAEKYGGGDIRGVLSVDISDWETVAPRLGRAAKDCTREEVLDETFRQIMDGLNRRGNEVIGWDDVACRHLDNNVKFGGPENRATSNDTPLFVHEPGTYQYRPTAQTEIGNLSLASDYVATHTNLATMEGANEAARRAVKSILRREGCIARLPRIRTLSEPMVFQPFRRFDAWLMSQDLGLDHMFDLGEVELSELLAQAERVSQKVSLPRMRAFVRRMSSRSGVRASAPRSVARARSTFRQMAGSMSKAEVLASRRT
ncbi:MAG: FAD-dependent oxidoreductase, partial [Myxococcales bacterium]|nr:FAD-dependent oxidoreductase [Myxococcales bacterium]